MVAKAIGFEKYTSCNLRDTSKGIERRAKSCELYQRPSLLILFKSRVVKEQFKQIGNNDCKCRIGAGNALADGIVFYSLMQYLLFSITA